MSTGTLGYAPMHEDNAIDPLGHGSTVWMQDLNPQKRLRQRDALGRVRRPRGRRGSGWRPRSGRVGRIVDESEAPSAWILADRAGNKVCIVAWPDGARAAKSDEQA